MEARKAESWVIIMIDCPHCGKMQSPNNQEGEICHCKLCKLEYVYDNPEIK